jgi:hypothetical protein
MALNIVRVLVKQGKINKNIFNKLNDNVENHSLVLKE